jgi:hypothetical protein
MALLFILCTMIVSVVISVLYSGHEGSDNTQARSTNDFAEDEFVGCEINDDLHLRALIESKNAVRRI